MSGQLNWEDVLYQVGYSVPLLLAAIFSFYQASKSPIPMHPAPQRPRLILKLLIVFGNLAMYGILLASDVGFPVKAKKSKWTNDIGNILGRVGTLRRRRGFERST
jgi:hypothetical protein